MAIRMKSKGGNLVLWVVMALLVLGLAGFGVTNFSGSLRSIGSVGDRDISVASYANALQQEINAFGAQIGQNVTFQQAQALGLDRAVRARVITTAALDNEAARLGVSVGDAEVRRALLAIPAFRGLDGQFDPEAYAETLRQNRLNIRDFEATVRDEAARNLLQMAVAGGVAAPAEHVDLLYRYLTETRGFTRVTLDDTALAEPVPAPDAAQQDAYYQANAALFTRPEAKRITYAWLTPDMLLDRVEVDETALRELYQARIAEFVQPERRLVERLAFATEADAAAAKARLDAGAATFDALVTERGLQLTDVDLGDVTPADLGEAGAAVFALAEPGVVGPFASPLGPALFRMNAVLAAQETSFEEARETLGGEAAMDRARRLIADQITDIEDRLAGGATLEDLADETDMELGTIDWFEGMSEGIAAYEAFRDAAATLAAEDFPEITDLADGGIVALRLDEILPPALIPLPEVQDQVIAGWTADETAKRLNARAEAIVAALGSGQDFAAQGQTPEVVAPLPRDGFIEGAPPALLEAVFQMAEGETRVIPGEAGRVEIVTLTSVTEAPGAPAPDSPEGELQAGLREQLAQSLAQDAFELFATAVEAEAGIRINEAAVNAVHAQFQ